MPDSDSTAGYLVTLLHEYKYCAKLPPTEVAAWCD